MNANLLALISPADGTVRATVPLLGPPADVAAAPGSLWVAEADAHQVVRINPKRRAVTATIPFGTAPSRIIERRPGVGAGSGRPHRVPDRPAGRHGGADDRTWRKAQRSPAHRGQPVGSPDAGRRDGTADRSRHRAHPRHHPDRRGTRAGLAAADGAVWVATQPSGTLARIDARTGTLRSTTRVGDAPAVTGTGPAGLWVLDPLDATVSRVEARGIGTVTATIPLGGAPTAMVQSGGGVWLADRRNGTLLRLAPRARDGHEVPARRAPPRARRHGRGPVGRR